MKTFLNAPQNRVTGEASLFIRGLFIRSLLLTAFFWGLWLSAVPAPAFADWGLNPRFVSGAVGTRGLILEDGAPVWVAYGSNGEVLEKIGPATDRYRDARAMAASEYSQRVAAFRDALTSTSLPVSIENLPLVLLGVSFHPDTKSILRIAPSALSPGMKPLLHESPLNLKDVRDLGEEIRSVLLDDKGSLLHASIGNIGYLSGFYSQADGTPGGQALGGYRQGDTLWGPVSGAFVSAGGDWRSGKFTREDGHFQLMYHLPPCPGFSYNLDHFVFGQLLYQEFNPKRPRPVGHYFVQRPIFDMCSGGSAAFGMPTSLGAAMGQMAAAQMDAGINQSFHRNVNLTVDVAAITGRAFLHERVGGPVLPLGEKTRRSAKASSGWVLPAHLDFNGDGRPDTAELDPATGLVRIWFEGKTEENKDTPDLERFGDTFLNLKDEGLVSAISAGDAEKIDTHIYRASSGMQIMASRGLQAGSLISEDKAALSYRMLYRGPGDFAFRHGGNAMSIWQKERLNPALQGFWADHLRPGEAVRVYLINRATGYMGSAVTTIGEGTQSGLISTQTPTIALTPPNLKVQVRRVHAVSHGADQGEIRDQFIGFEGAGLTSDTFLEISTLWMDADGGPLPDDLPGFTGRLARVVAPGSLGGEIRQFRIRPGRQVQVLKLPEEGIDAAHFYIHVSPLPPEGVVGASPDFSSEFSSQGGLENPADLLGYRPKTFVPILVPVFDRAATREAERLRSLRMKKEGVPLPEIKPIYHWVYRPEMQFSLLDLKVEEPEKEPEKEEPTPPAGPVLDGALVCEEGNLFNLLKSDLLYTLVASELNPLPLFGQTGEMVFSFGGQEVKATVQLQGGEIRAQTLKFQNAPDLASLTPEELVTLRLYQNRDAANVLWEYATVLMPYIEIDNGKGLKNQAIAPGATATGKAVTLPKDRKVRWSLRAAKKGVHVTLDPETGRIAADDNTEDGWILIRATDEKMPERFREALVHVGCAPCTPCEGTACENRDQPGGGAARLASVEAHFALGLAEGGQSAGELFILGEALGLHLASPKSLGVSVMAKDVHLLRDESGLPRQVVAPETFVDIVVTGAGAYEMRFYHPSAAAAQGDDGLFEPIPGETPFVVWEVEGTFDSLILREVRKGSVTGRHRYERSGNTWRLIRADGELVEEKTLTSDGLEVRKTRDAKGHVARSHGIRRAEIAGRSVITERIQDPGGANLVTRYVHDSTGRVKEVIRPDGAWTRSERDDQGRVTKEIRPHGEDGADSEESLHSYAPVSSEDSQRLEDADIPRLTEIRIQGVLTQKIWRVFTLDAEGRRVEILEESASPSNPFGDEANRRTVRIYHKEDGGLASGKLFREIAPEGRTRTHKYVRGFFDGGSGLSAPTFKADPGGAFVEESVIHGISGAEEGVFSKTTVEIRVKDAFGRTLMTGEKLFDGGYHLARWQVSTLDDLGRVTHTRSSDGSRTETTWSCCTKVSERDALGVLKIYTHDALNRVIREEREGLGGAIVTEYTYDAAGRVLEQRVEAGGLVQTTKSFYDGAGRRIRSLDASGLETRWEYDVPARTTTRISPGGAREVTTRSRDGRLLSVTGDAGPSRYYAYGVTPEGFTWSKTHFGAKDSPLWEKEYADALGRTLKTERPGFGGGVVTTSFSYDAKGRLAKAQSPGTAPTLYEYDTLGNLVMTGLDVDENGILEENSQDRITATDTRFVKLGADWWEQSETRIYNDEGETLRTSLSRTRLTGLGPDGRVAESVSQDIHGNLTRMRVHRDPATASETRHMESPSSPMAEVTVSRFGLTLTHRDTSGHERSFGWDALGRRISETDAADHTTRFIYDNETGRKIQDIDATGQSVRYAYDMRGQLTATWGDATYPVRYGYDALGRMVSMTTFREGEGFEGEAFPQDPMGDTTSWIYDEATGLLLAKRDAQGRDVTYQYDAAGRTRTWARQEAGADLVTTYAYDGATGDLLGVNYSDATPGVTFTYNRLGQQKTITDGLGTRTLVYNPALQPVSESITGLYERSLGLGYEETGLKGRISGFSLQSPDSKTYAISYGFDRFGRFESLNWEVLNQKDQVRYARVQNADLIAGYETDSGQITSYTYEPHRNLKTRVENAFHTRLISAYTYNHDALGRRENVQQTGLAFVKDNFNLYTYNPRSEVTASRSFEGEDISDLNQALSERSREYSYDPMGNRRAATLGPEALEYSTNPLNQYTAVTGLAPITHDADGNFKEMGDRVFVWNAENRLIRTEPRVAVLGDSRTEYAYDYMGRRVQKISYLFDGTDWVKGEERLFVYQGWNLIEEIRLGEGKEESRYFVWGLDLSQSLQGAGGVGGLLAMVEEGGSHLYAFDANGNVGQVVKASDGSLAAAYEYDPFGRLTASSGGMADVNPFRFSTKYFDGESGFYYYGYRYYAVALGRWVSRDPIGEAGGYNKKMVNPRLCRGTPKV